MADYIDREELLKYAVGLEENEKVVFEDVIDDMPSVDAVEVVRCKDCKYNNDGLCTKLCYIRERDNFKQPLAVRECYFCHWGVKKNEIN